MKFKAGDRIRDKRCTNITGTVLDEQRERAVRAAFPELNERNER